MIKSGGDGSLRCIIVLFNDVLAGGTAPGDWKTASITVMFKSGECQLSENSRPISLLPILYKLFTKLLWSRVRKVLDDAQPVDQAGFRSPSSCEDHIIAIVLIAEAMYEYKCPLRMAKAIQYLCMHISYLWV